MTRALAGLAALLLLLYPLLIYFGGQWLEPRYLGLALASIYGLRLFLTARRWEAKLAIGIALGLLAAALWHWNDERLLRLWPALINALLACYFTYTLYRPPTLPARMASREFSHGLPPLVEWYTRKVTQVWVVFFVFNGALACYTALFSSRELWALYNGLLAYGLIGLLFALEYGYRTFIFKKKHGL
ncbi:hypothetical protein [Gilvimarinus sp. DA14]|uniref:COG4648 family protein n=1 Tax=Gilvimarinus sp. DA14 TaxID=2956798 RepID=UPI0020B85FAD|nr:hypothetical protein [Gilvimarinus sp. DA14]UTF59724.1 hypothetical protein NHM04_14815 [Gilvimarinus sp. DA14]